MESNYNVVSVEPRSQEPATPSRTRKHKLGTNGGLWYLNRALVYTAYLPLVLIARLFLNFTRLHGEARSITVTEQQIDLPRLLAAFDGLKVAFLTDFHASPLNPSSFLERAVAKTVQLKPDLILLGGDYVSDGTDYIQTIEKILAHLDAPLGTYAVLGNHDFESDVDQVSAALKRSGVVELTNHGRWLSRGSSRIRIAGVGDWWSDDQDLSTALDGAENQDTVILMSHNPDFAMEISDPRVDLVVSGHTHGGQIHLPRMGPLLTNSRYGKRFVGGLVYMPTFQLYVSRGLGTVMVPFRYHCPPEITLLTLCRNGAGTATTVERAAK